MQVPRVHGDRLLQDQDGFLEAGRSSHPGYFCRPVPPFGDERPKLLIVGLAPGFHGANKTGRPFTGDHAGILLYETLHAFGYADRPISVSADDGLKEYEGRLFVEPFKNDYGFLKGLGFGIAGSTGVKDGTGAMVIGPAGENLVRFANIRSGHRFLGRGGMGAARALVGENAGIEVTLVETNGRFMSCPMSTHFIAGHAPETQFQFGYDGLDRLGIRRITATVVDIDRAKKALVLGDGRRVDYDFLVLSPGIEYMEDAVAGYAQARALAPVGFRAFEQAAVKQQFDKFLAEGGEFVVTVPAQPYRCPPAPHERAFMLAELVKARRVKGKIIVLDENAAPMPPPISPAIMEAYNERYRGVTEYIPQAKLQAIDAGSRTIRTSVGDFKFSACNTVLPMRAPALIRKAGLGERWAAVKLPTFQSARRFSTMECLRRSRYAAV